MQEVAEGLAGNFGDDEAEDYVAGIAVVPLRGGREHGVIGLFEESEDFGVLDLVFLSNDAGTGRWKSARRPGPLEIRSLAGRRCD